MKFAAAVIAAALVVPASCRAAPAAPVRIEVDKSFVLKPGTAARTVGDEVRVTFVGVTGDSRCPAGAQCVRAGDATVRLWVQQGATPRAAHELRADPGAAQALPVNGQLALRLVRLDPQPVVGKPTAAAAYRATFLLSRDTRIDIPRR